MCSDLILLTIWTDNFLLQIYIMDIHIWYTLLSAIYGAVMGARSRLGEVLVLVRAFLSIIS